MIKTDTITPFQLFSITVFSMIFGLRMYPSVVNHDITYEWLTAQIISILLVFLILMMSVSVFSSFGNMSFTEIIASLIGDIPSRVLGLILTAYFILHSLNLILLESNNIQLFLFDKTPISVIAAVIAITAFLLSVSGLRPLARLTETLAVPIIIVISIMLLVCLSGSDFGEVKTLFQPDAGIALSQLRKTVSCFFCIEMTAYYICQANDRKKAKKALFIGYSVCSVIMLILTLCIAGTFTLKAGAELIYPVTELARTIQLKYLRLIERLDAVMIAVSITYTCIFTSLACYCASGALSMTFRKLKIRHSIPVYLILLILLFAGIKASFFDILSAVLLIFESAVLFFIIPALFLISIIKRKGKKHDRV